MAAPRRSQALPILAPRGYARPAMTKSASFLPEQHTDKEWAVVYPHIVRMYVLERRKLRYVMTKMEEEFHFKATPQMYKKRFAKWGLQKNTKRARQSTDETVASPRSETVKEVKRNAERLEKCTKQFSLSREMSPSASDAATLILLTSIRSWSSSFFEMVQSAPPEPMYCTKAISTFNPDRLSFSFRVIVGLLERGQGVLAGRLARKVFPQAEALLNIDGPPFIWNILDIIYGIGIYGQTQLLHMLLQYLIGVARSNYPPTHPILHILRSLKSLVHSWEDNAEPFQVATLEQGWALNANLLFGRFNSKFILLYYRLEWDSALFKLPQAWVKEADWWFSALESEITPDNPIPEEMMETDLDRSHPFDAEFRTELPGNYERLKSDVIATIEERSSMDFDDPRVRVRVLSGRLKSLTLQDDDAGRSKSQFIGAAQKKTRTLRLHARILAFLIKIVIESDADLGVSDELAVEKTRNIIALQKFGQGPIDPQVVYELWQLERLLLQRGDSEQAAATREETYKLLEHYLVDVPVDMDYIPART